MLINFNVTCQNYFITSVISICDFYTISSFLESLKSDVANLKYLDMYEWHCNLIMIKTNISISEKT